MILFWFRGEASKFKWLYFVFTFQLIFFKEHMLSIFFFAIFQIWTKKVLQFLKKTCLSNPPAVWKAYFPGKLPKLQNLSQPETVKTQIFIDISFHWFHRFSDLRQSLDKSCVTNTSTRKKTKSEKIVYFIKITLFYMSYKRFLEINHSHELMSMQDKREKWSFFSAPEFCLQLLF